MVLTTLISAHDERFWSNRFTCTGCKRPIQGGCEYSLVSTRGFKVKSEEERGNWESPNICNWVNEYSCRLCEEVETTYLSLSKRAFFGTRPRVLLRSVYPIYTWVVVSRRREGVSLPCKANDCMGGNALKIRSNDWWLRSAKARGLWVVESENESSSTPEYEISVDSEQWLVAPICQGMTSRPLRHQGKFLICLFSLKIRSNDWRLRCARAWKVVQVLEQVSNAPDTSEVLEKRWELRVPE